MLEARYFATTAVLGLLTAFGTGNSVECGEGALPEDLEIPVVIETLQDARAALLDARRAVDDALRDVNAIVNVLESIQAHRELSPSDVATTAGEISTNERGMMVEAGDSKAAAFWGDLERSCKRAVAFFKSRAVPIQASVRSLVGRVGEVTARLRQAAVDPAGETSQLNPCSLSCDEGLTRRSPGVFVLPLKRNTDPARDRGVPEKAITESVPSDIRTLLQRVRLFTVH